MDRCSGSERRPNLDHHVSNPSPHFDPAAGVFLRRPTVPRRLGRKTLRCPRRWRGGPDRHFSVGRQPSLRAGSPAPPRSRTAAVSPGRLSAFCMLSGQSPHSARPRSFVSEVVTDVRPIHPPLLAHCPGLRSSASPSRHQPRIVWNTVPTPSVISRPASHRAYPSSALRAPLQVQFPPLAALTSPPTAPVRSRRNWRVIRMESSISPSLAVEKELSVSPGLRVRVPGTSLGLDEIRKDRVRGVKRHLEVHSFW